jgi:hypothetical protein
MHHPGKIALWERKLLVYVEPRVVGRGIVRPDSTFWRLL